MAKDPRVEPNSNDGDQLHRSQERASPREFFDTQQDIQWKWHPRQKFVYELLAWIAVIALVFFVKPSSGASGFWHVAVTLAYVGWIFPVFRLLQWWRLPRKSELDL